MSEITQVINSGAEVWTHTVWPQSPNSQPLWVIIRLEVSDRVRVRGMGETGGEGELSRGESGRQQSTGPDDLNRDVDLTTDRLDFSETRFSGLCRGIKSPTWSHGR